MQVVSEREFWYLGRHFKMRHYDDEAWELLDDNDLPIVQGYCKKSMAEVWIKISGPIIFPEPIETEEHNGRIRLKRKHRAERTSL